MLDQQPTTNNKTMKDFVNDYQDMLQIGSQELPPLLKNLSVHKLRHKISRSKIFVKPNEFQLGSENASTSSGANVFRKMAHNKFYYFSIVDSVIALLQDRKRFEAVLREDYSDPTVIRSDLDGGCNKKADMRPQFGDGRKVKIIIRLLMYLHEIEVCNALGPKTTKHKVMGYYMRIMNGGFKGHLDEIFTYAFVHSEFIKKYKYNKVFVPLVEEILKAKDGIEIYLHGWDVTLNFKLIGITGDNLGLNGVFRIKLGQANRFCRECRIDKHEFRDNPARVALERNNQYYREAQRVIKSHPKGSTARKEALTQYGYSSPTDSILKKN